ncbi:hypothetical protein KBC54_03970 [Patescibacteria group bacterium]|nr:hypothetical protein [Patescibacteria group bacterium]
MFHNNQTLIRFHKTVAGFSLIEAMLAIAFIALFSSSVFMYFGTQLYSATDANQSLIALERAKEGLEAARSIRDTGWSNLAVGTHGLALTSGTWGFQSTSDTLDGTTRTIAVTSLSTNEKQIVSTVTWSPTPATTRTETLATNISNWRNIVAPTGDVVPHLTGNWNNPQTLGTIDLGAGIEATGVAVKNKIVYISGTASNSGKSDFFVINALDGANPTIAASLNTGPGLNDVVVTSTFAYVASADSSNQLQILNISATATPTVIKSFTLTGNNEEAMSIAVTGTLAIIGTEADSNKELYIVDISNPSSPVIKSSVEIGGDVNRIIVREQTVYLATSSSTSEFFAINISNPNVPTISSKVNLVGTNPATGIYVSPDDHRAYITRDQAGGTSPEVLIYDVTAPSSPILLGSSEFAASIPSVFVADSLLFLGTNTSNLEFQLFTSTDPTNLVYVSGLNFPQYMNDMAFEDNVLYVALRSNDALRIITSQ